ncbi:MAG TPA: SIMPL domain-containing protein [Gaiellaceae bacterium]
MRRLFPLVLLAAAVLAAAAFAGIGRPEAARGDVTTPDTVTTLGHGVITVAPDEATVTAGVHTQAASASAALAENAKLMNAVVAALRAAGGQKLQTQQVSLYPQTDPQGQVSAYVADDSVSANTKIADAGALIDAAVGAGANTVSGPTLSVSDSDARYRDALGKAVTDARLKAEALAQAGGFGVGPVSSVTEQSAGGPTPVFQAVGAAAKTASTPIEPGTQDVTADVSVTFRIR